MSILQAIRESGWSPKFGDPTILGWITVLGYFLVFLICVKNMIVLKNNEVVENRNKELVFFIFLTVAIFLLGLNKQLDLQSFITGVFRTIARNEGWYSERRFVQKEFIMWISLISVASFFTVLIWLRKSIVKLGVTLFGLCALIGFVLIRAASFHHVDVAFRYKIGDFKLYSVIELSALVIIFIGVLLSGFLQKEKKVESLKPNRENENGGWHKFGSED